MKKILLLPICLLLIICARVQAQQVGALTIFSEAGEKFYLVLNGLRQNTAPQTNVRVDGLSQPQYDVKIIFENTALPEISKNYLRIADANQQMMDVTYRIKHDKNGMPKLGVMPTSFIPYQQAAPPQDVYVVHYGQADQPAATTVSKTTTTTTTAPATSVNVNMTGMPGGMTVSAPATSATTVQTTTTETTTTTREGTSVPAQQAAQEGCRGAYPMSGSDFASALATVKQQGFDETKLSTAKQIAEGNCLSPNQVADICKAFGFEETKLSFAKFAYKHCTEPQNYFKINNVFGFSTSVDDLNSYIQKTYR